MLEDGQTEVVLQVVVQAHPRSALPQFAGQSGLAHLDRLLAQIGAIQLQQVEGVEEGLRLVPAVSDQWRKELGLTRREAADELGVPFDTVRA